MAERGRPKSDNIFRFNVATDLTDNKRFIRFKRALGADEPTAYLTLVRFFNYVAANCALSARIMADSSGNNSEDDAGVIADFCYWAGEPSKLIEALRQSGFLEADGTVHEWLENQPYAKEKQSKRVVPPDSSGNKADSSGNNYPPTEDRSTNNNGRAKNTGAPVDAHARENPDPNLLLQIDDFMAELITVTKISPNDQAGIRFDLIKHGLPDGEKRRMILDKLHRDKSEKKSGEKGLVSPVGWTRKQIQNGNRSP